MRSCNAKRVSKLSVWEKIEVEGECGVDLNWNGRI